MTNYRIFVNGYSKAVGSWNLSYEFIAELAFGLGAAKSNPSITYHNGDVSDTEGILKPGQSVRGNHDMQFDVAHTGGA